MKILRIISISVLIIGLASSAFAQGAIRSARITSISGEAVVRMLGQRAWIPAKTGMTLKQGDTIKTKADSWALLKIDEAEDAAFIELEENSQVLFSRFEEDKESQTRRTLLDLPIGELLIRVENLPAESKFEVKTPVAIAGARGTRFSVKVEALK